MSRTRSIMFAAAGVLLGACDRADPTSPLLSPPTDASVARGGAATCVIATPQPVARPLPAIIELVREINEAAQSPASSLTCGEIRSLEAKFETLVKKLDADFADQQLDAACGVSRGILNELEALVKTGRLDPIIAPPPIPGAGTDLVENFRFLNSRFCENAAL